jgi:urease accessory protein
LNNGLGHTDLPLLARARRRWLAVLQTPEQTSGPPPDDVLAIAEWLLSLRESRELREEEQRLGSALARLLGTLDVPRAECFAGHAGASYVVLYGLAAAHWQIAERAALSGFAFAWLENQIGAACRVLSLGQHKAQFTLSRVLLDIPPTVDAALALPDDRVGACAPGLAMASAWHEEQYSRLFRS